MNKNYPEGRKHFGNGDINWLSNTIKIAALTGAYTYSAAHEFVSDLAGIVARSNAIGSKTNVGGILSGANDLFPALTGAMFLYLVIYKDTGVDATSPLLYYIDTGTNLPTTPNGIDLYVQADPPTGFLQV